MHEMHLRGILLLLCIGAECGDRLSDRRERFGGVGDAGSSDLHRAKPVAAAVDDMVCGRPCGGFDAVCSQHFACTDAHHIRRDRGNTHAHIEERSGTPHNAVHRGAAAHVGSRINQGKQRNGFPPVKGGDVTFVSGDLHPLEDHLGGEADG